MKSRWVISALVASSFTTSLANGQSGYFCDEPYPPRCIDAFGTFDDEWSFDQCRDDVEDYVRDVQDFQSCLSNWFEAMNWEVDDVIDEFNCMAQGNSFCP